MVKETTSVSDYYSHVSDAAFCRYRLAGPNPIHIAPCVTDDNRPGDDWEKMMDIMDLKQLPEDRFAEVKDAFHAGRVYKMDLRENAKMKSGMNGTKDTVLIQKYR